jgi:hypothetical protein
LTYRGPANYIPVTLKDLKAVALSAGIEVPRSCPKGFFAILYGRHLYRTFLIACQTSNIQNKKGKSVPLHAWSGQDVS